MSATFNFQMPIEMFNTPNDAFAFGHAWTGAKSDGVTLFAAFDSCVWFVRIAPGSTSVNKDFELTGDIGPVGRSNRYNNVCPFVFGNDFKNIILRIILLKTFGGIVTTTAAFAKQDVIIIYTNCFNFLNASQTVVTISAVAPFLTGLQFMTKTFILNTPFFTNFIEYSPTWENCQYFGAEIII